MTWLSSKRRMLLALPFLLTTSACALLTPTPALHDPVMVACKAFALLHEDAKNDTLETVKQIRLHNAVYHKTCDGWGGVTWGPPK